MTRRELITGIFLMAHFQPSFKKLAAMPLDRLKELYLFLYYGDSLEIDG